MDEAHLEQNTLAWMSANILPNHGIISQNDYDIKMLQEQQNHLLLEINNLSELVGLIYSALGIEIKDYNGNLRSTSDIEQDLRLLNPKILLSFKELMQL